jgi:G:T-mismatch repair DNA endonuclease (very short patch repair protein)
MHALSKEVLRLFAFETAWMQHHNKAARYPQEESRFWRFERCEVVSPLRRLALLNVAKA